MSDRCKRVMIAMDNSKGSWRAWQWYLMNLHKETNYVLLVHAAEHGGLVTPPIPLADSTVYRFEHEEDEINYFVNVDLTKKLDEEGVTGCALRIWDITPGKAIVKASKTYKADMIIVGNQGHGAFHKLIHGSVNDYVLEHSNIPVMRI